MAAASPLDRMQPRHRVAVLGAGITGICAALELARAGIDVLLIEQDEQAVNRAGLRNEGKVHLGLVYAKDDSLRTADRMLDGALSFRPILRRLLGREADEIPLSTPFLYLVPHDSLMNPDELESRYRAIEAICLRRLRSDTSLDYLGTRPQAICRRVPLDTLSPRIGTSGLAGAFASGELAVDTDALAGVLRRAVGRCRAIRFVPGHHVEAVVRTPGGFSIRGTSRGTQWEMRAEQVVNALWSDRIRIDRTAGLEPCPGWLHRLKYRVIATLPPAMRGGPSATLVVGRYGDVVVRPDGTGFFSWYPVGLRGWTHEDAPPDTWNLACTGGDDPSVKRDLAHSVLAAIDHWYPGAAAAVPLAVDAGVIVARGNTDVGDPDSGLHERTRIGVVSRDGYHSVDPGKLTTAPLFGVEAARRVLETQRNGGESVAQARVRQGGPDTLPAMDGAHSSADLDANPRT